jgi:ATP-dependent helicase Lhr and Lhr-like helicase
LKKSNFYKLDPKLQELLRNSGFHSLRKIQEDSIESQFNNENLLIVAPTASGKTEAALLPIISSILCDNTNETSLKCIYIAPLKALLNDIESRLFNLKNYEDSQPYILKWHGDVPRSKKLKGLKDVPDILLITPESLEVLFISPHIDQVKLFEQVKFIVIDEVHNFSSNPRGAQLISLISRIENISNYSIQKIGLSATVGNPDKILEWMTSKSQLKSKYLISEDTSKKIKIKIYHIKDDNDEDRFLKILSTLCKDGKTIIFNNSRYFTEDISKKLENLNIECYVHHGSLSKFIREEAEDKIKNEINGVISATSTLELGIDIGDLDKAIQIQNFASVNSFLQRLGRTGRRSHKNPFIVSITDNNYDFLINLAIISLGVYNKFTEPINPSTRRYDILLQQLLSHAISYYGAGKIKFWNIVKNAYCFIGITKIEYDYLIQFWTDNGLIRIINDDILLGEIGEKYFARRNYLELFSVFESNDQYEVIFNKYSIGVLDSWFVKSKEGKFLFRLAGKKWRTDEIDDERKLIYVSLTSQGVLPVWMGGSFIEIDFRVAQRVREIITGEFDCSLFDLDYDEIDALINIKKGKEFIGIVKSEILITITEDGLSLITYTGTMYNTMLSYLIKYYSGVTSESNDYASILYKKKSFAKENLYELLLKIKSNLNYNTIYDILLKEIKIWKYSKFAEFIPEDLSKKFIISEYYNIDEFINYFKDVTITM